MIFLELYQPHGDLSVRYGGPYAVRTSDLIERYETLVDSLIAAKEIAIQSRDKITLCTGDALGHQIATPNGEDMIISSWQIHVSEGSPHIKFTHSKP